MSQVKKLTLVHVIEFKSLVDFKMIRLTFCGIESESNSIVKICSDNKEFVINKKTLKDDMKKYHRIYDTKIKKHVKEIINFFSSSSSIVVFVFGSYCGDSCISISLQSLETRDYGELSFDKKKYKNKDSSEVKNFGATYACDEWYMVYGIFDLGDNKHVENLFSMEFWTSQFTQPTKIN